jgi:hypothetical protein
MTEKILRRQDSATFAARAKKSSFPASTTTHWGSEPARSVAIYGSGTDARQHGILYISTLREHIADLERRLRALNEQIMENRPADSVRFAATQRERPVGRKKP